MTKEAHNGKEALELIKKAKKGDTIIWDEREMTKEQRNIKSIDLSEHRRLLYQQRMKGRMEGELIGNDKDKAAYETMKKEMIHYKNKCMELMSEIKELKQQLQEQGK